MNFKLLEKKRRGKYVFEFTILGEGDWGLKDFTEEIKTTNYFIDNSRICNRENELLFARLDFFPTL